MRRRSFLGFNDIKAWLRAIREAPKDDSLLLVFADWLEEREEYAAATAVRTLVPPRPTPRTRAYVPDPMEPYNWRVGYLANYFSGQEG